MSSSGAAMLRTGRALLTGRHLIKWLCPFTGSKWRRVYCSCSLGTQEVTFLENVKDNVDQAYTVQEGDTSLHLLNMDSESQLDCVKELQEKKATDVLQFHEQNAPFQELETLHLVQPPLIPKVSDSKVTCTTKANRKIAKFLKPNIPLCKLQEVKSIVSIVFGLKKLAWAHIDCTMTVREWRQRECFHFTKEKHLPELYLEGIASVVSILPQADLYVLEKPSISNQNSSLFPVVIHLRTVEAMLYCLLNPRLIEEQEHRVFSMTRNTVGKHFEIMLGELRTSGVDVVQRLIDEAVISAQPRVNFPSDIVKQYRQHLQARGKNRNEEACDALLQAITFYELALT